MDANHILRPYPIVFFQWFGQFNLAMTKMNTSFDLQPLARLLEILKLPIYVTLHVLIWQNTIVQKRPHPLF